MIKRLPPQTVFLRAVDSSAKELFKALREIQKKSKKPRLIVASDEIVGLKELPSAVHSRLTMYVMEEIIEKFRGYLPAQADGTRRRHDLELCGDGCKDSICSVHNS